MNHNGGMSGHPRGLLWLAVLVYTAFVIYGSLVPLDFHALPWDEAVARFGSIPFLNSASVRAPTGWPTCCCSFR